MNTLNWFLAGYAGAVLIFAIMELVRTLLDEWRYHR